MFEEDVRVDDGVTEVGEERGEGGEVPEIGRGGPAVMGSTLGRNVELISPIPTKKSSIMQKWCITSAKRSFRTCENRSNENVTHTWNYFDEVRTPLPYIRPVINDHHHTRITWEQPLQAFLCQTPALVPA